MVTPIKVDGMAFSGHAETLKEELAKTYIKKAIEWVQAKNITDPLRVSSLASYLLRKAEGEYESRLAQQFPHPYYEPYISMICIGSTKFFDDLGKKIEISINKFLAQPKV